MGILDTLQFWKKKDDGLKNLDIPGVGTGPGSMGGSIGAAEGFGTTSGFSTTSASGFGDMGGAGGDWQKSAGIQSMQNSAMPGISSSSDFMHDQSFGALSSGRLQNQQSFQQGSAQPTAQPSGVISQRQFYEVPQQQQMQAQQMQNQMQQQSSRSADMQVLDAKLDAIKAMLDSINQRLANLERMAYDSQNTPPRRPW